MACGLGQWPILPPAGHSPINKLRIVFQAPVWPQAQALHDTGAKTFHQAVCRRNELAADSQAFIALKVQRQVDAATQKHVLVEGILGAWPGDTNHLCTQICKQHARKWTRSNASHFNDLDSRQRSFGHEFAPGSFILPLADTKKTLFMFC